MRIEGPNRSSGLARSGGANRSTGGGFFIDDGAPVARSVSAQPAVAAGSIDALLALQAADDPLVGRRKAVRRGSDLLDTLDEIKADLLVGGVSAARLDRLMALIGEARERQVPGLDAVLDDIELRARVELAKFGRFPVG